MRSLQEIGHNAMHYAMCRSKGWQWLLSNFFSQFPLMKRDMHSRFVTHVKEHHRSPNDPDKDPNLRRIIEGACGRG
jgi:fatty acid desaturase